MRRLWTVDEFDLAAKLGLFGPDERLELIDGDILQKMSSHESTHSTGIRLIEEALRKAFAVGHDVRVQMPLVFGNRNKPEPDVDVVTGSIRDCARQQPTTAVLVVEVAGSSLTLDRTVKAALYARAGIPEYWILNLPDRVLEVHRQPAPMSGQPLGYHYRQITRYSDNDTISPIAAPNYAVALVDILP